MSSFHSTIRRAQRRILLNRTMRLVGWGVATGLFLGLLLVTAERLFQLQLATRMLLYPAVAGVLAGIVAAFLTRPSETSTAIHLDRELRLKDRMGTARALEEARLAANHDAEFAALVGNEAQRISGGVDLKYATPMRITGIWAATIILAAALWLGNAFIPERQTNQQSDPTSQGAQTAQLLQQQSEELSQSIEQVVRELPADELDSQTAEEIAALDRLAEQLRDPLTSPQERDSIRDDAAARLDEVADRLAEQAERDQAAAEELVQRFQGIESQETPEAPLSAEEFADALKRGEFGQAAQELEKLLNEESTQPPAERKATAEELRRLAEQIDQLSQEQSPQTQLQRGQLEQALRDQGLDEQTIDELMENPPSPEEVERELQERNIDPEIARDLARDMEELQEQQRIQEQAQRDGEDVAEALERAAEELENPPTSPPQSPTQSPAQTQPAATQPASQQPQPESNRPEAQQPPQTRPQEPQQQTRQPQRNSSDQQRADESREHPGEQSEQSDATESAPQQSQTQPSEQTKQEGSQPQNQDQPKQQQQQDSGGSKSESQQQQQQQSTTQPSRQQPSTQPSAQSQPQQQQQQQQQQSGSEPQQQQPTRQPGASDQQQQQEQQRDQQQGEQQQRSAQQSPDAPRQQNQPQPQNQPNQRQTPNQQRQQQPSDQNQGENQVQQRDQQQQPAPTPSETLRRLAERRKGESQQQHAERMRELAREMSENMTPEQRDQWAKQWQRQNQPQDQQQTPKQSPGGTNDLEKDAQQIAGSQGGKGEPIDENALPQSPARPPQTEDLDLRGEEPANQLITQWLTGEKIEPGAEPSRFIDPAQRVRQAQEVAERAVNESAVQKRYHKMIKRYFGRLPQTIEQPGGGGSSPPPPAPAQTPPPAKP